MVTDSRQGDVDRELFVGRAHELEMLRACAKKVTAGTPQVVHIEGEPGIGKTHLVRRFVDQLSGFTVLTASGDPGESALAYGVIDQILSRADKAILEKYEQLSRRRSSATTPFSMGADLLDLISELQQTKPIAIVVDDVQWSDRASAQALGFVLRRLWADQVLLVLVTRTLVPTDHAEGITDHLSRHKLDSTTLRLGGLTSYEVATLCTSVIPATELTPPAAAKLHAHTAGNPLYLRALLEEASPDQLLAAEPDLPVPKTLQTAVASTLRRLPEPSRRIVEALSVLNTRSPLARVARLADVEDPSAALAPTLDSNLVLWWPNEPANPVALRHSLQRDAIYGTLSPARRVELHRKAASLVDSTAAWAHRVAASQRTDARLANDLELAAAEQTAAGQHDIAARYLSWAADLSESRAEYERRLLTGCIQSLLTSHPGWAVRMRDEIERCAPTPLRHCALGLTHTFGIGNIAEGERWLQMAIDAAAQSDTPEWITSTAAGALAGAHLWRGKGEPTVSAASLALDSGQLDTRMADFVRMFRAVGESRQHGLIAGLETLTHLPRRPSSASDDDLECLACRGALYTMLGQYDDAISDLKTSIARQRAGADILSGPSPHSYLATAQFAIGNWDDAAITMQQALSIQAAYEQPQHYTLARMAATFVPAARGQWSTARHHADAAVQWALRVNTPQDRRYAAIAEGTLAHARGDLAGMRAAVSLLLEAEVAPEGDAHAWWQPWWQPLLVETLIETGELEEAEQRLHEFRQSMTHVQNMADTLCRLKAALARERGNLDEAISIYQEGVRADRPSRTPFPHALLQHDYARLLLTTGHRREARAWLERARELFTELGATPYAQRVDHDLAAAGSSPQAHQSTSHPLLTEREQQVMHLARRGRTNREIAQELYVTSKTVEYHLSNIFAKLGITSRRQLRNVS